MPSIGPDRVQVAVGVIRDAEGRVLLSRRPEHTHQGGLWEFPGGKVEPGEGPGQALARELHEELGIELLGSRPLIKIAHDYTDCHVLLDVRLVGGYRGTPQALEGQPLAWAALEDLPDYSLPAADGPILTALRLPDRYLITPDGSVDSLLEHLAWAIEAGARLIQLRAKSLGVDRLRQLAQEALPACRAAGARLLVNGPLELAREVDIDGVHLSSKRLMALRQRPLGLDRWVGASCHNGDQLAHAQRIGADLAVLSPVLHTPSHPEARPLGWQAFSRLVEGVSLPVYALGGMRPDMLQQAWAAGAQGIAGIRGLWPMTGLRFTVDG
jgi:8-oxo-dGTP diphosphatase